MCLNLFSENYGWVNSIQGLRLRSSADLDAEVLDVIPESERVQILIVDKTRKVSIDGFDDYWMNVKYKNNSGWVYGAYISDVKILDEAGYKKVSNLLIEKVNSRKTSIRNFFRNRLKEVEHYKYEIENALPARVQIFMEIIRYDDRNYVEEISYDFLKWKYDYKKMYSEFYNSIKSSKITVNNKLFNYDPKNLKIESSGKTKYISYDGFNNFNFSRSLIYFKRRSALLVTMTYYYDDDKIKNNLVYCSQEEKNFKYIYKDEGERYNWILEKIFLKTLEITANY